MPRGLPSGDVQEAVAYKSPEFRGEISSADLHL